MLTRLLSRRSRKGLRTPLAAMVVTAAMLPALTGCGQQAPTRANAAKSATDTVAQVQPAPPDSTAQQLALEQNAAAPPPAETAQQREAASRPVQKQTGIAALDRAAATGKYLLVVFYRNDDDSTRAMKRVVAGAAAKLKVHSVTVNMADVAEKDIIAKFGVERAPTPLTLVVAPNGAITGGFPGTVTEEQLSGTFVSPGLAKCLKALQEGKLVFACVQNAATTSNEAALKGVKEFKADPSFGQFTEVVSIDPTDAAESRFLAQLQIDSGTDVAVTAFIAPPGAVIAKYTGATDKNVMIATLTAATSGGCGAGGCAPSGCGPTR